MNTDAKEIKLILLPAELVPDLDAQITNQLLDLLDKARQEGADKEKYLREALDYIALVANKKNPHLGRPRSSDTECIFCLAYLALNDGAYGEHIEYKELSENMRASARNQTDV